MREQHAVTLREMHDTLQTADVVLWIPLRCVNIATHPAERSLTMTSIAGDNFLCNTCTAKHCPAPDLQVARHTYLHVLVRCKAPEEENAATQIAGELPPTDSSALEREVTMLRQHVEDQSTRIQNFETSFTRLEQLMKCFLERVNSGGAVDGSESFS